MSSEEDVLKRLERLEAKNDELRKLTIALFQSNEANKQNYEDLSRNVAESIVPYFASEMETLSKNFNEHYKAELNKHQTFWTTVAAGSLIALLGYFMNFEESHIQNTMTLQATHIQETFSQEKEKIDVVLNGFKEKLHTHHK